MKQNYGKRQYLQNRPLWEDADTVQGFVEGTTTGAVAAAKAPKGRKRSAYATAYKRAFKRQAPLYKKKNGQWKKDGFKRAVRAAHKAVKKR